MSCGSVSDHRMFTVHYHFFRLARSDSWTRWKRWTCLVWVYDKTMQYCIFCKYTKIKVMKKIKENNMSTVNSNTLWYVVSARRLVSPNFQPRRVSSLAETNCFGLVPSCKLNDLPLLDIWIVLWATLQCLRYTF